MSFILHSGAQPATLADLRNVEVPCTRSHRPIPYADSVEFLLEAVRKELKKGAVGSIIERHIDVHDYFMQQSRKPVGTNGAGKAIIDTTCVQAS